MYNWSVSAFRGALIYVGDFVHFCFPAFTNRSTEAWAINYEEKCGHTGGMRLEMGFKDGVRDKVRKEGRGQIKYRDRRGDRHSDTERWKTCWKRHLVITRGGFTCCCAYKYPHYLLFFFFFYSPLFRNHWPKQGERWAERVCIVYCVLLENEESTGRSMLLQTHKSWGLKHQLGHKPFTHWMCGHEVVLILHLWSPIWGLHSETAGCTDVQLHRKQSKYLTMLT